MATEPDAFPKALLARAHPPAVAEALYTERVVKRPLYIRATSPQPSARATRRKELNARKEKARARSTLKPRPLSAAKKRALGLLEIPKAQQKYEIYEGLHKLWAGYMAEILGLNGDGAKAFVTPGSSGQQLASADMHGAVMEIVRSRCPSRVGLKGIVVRDTKFTIELITEKNRVKAVPKEHTVFRFEVPVPGKEDGDEKRPLVFEILGEQFQTRGPERANRKFRMHYQPDL
ncbi:RNase P/MRP, p29 subunit [Bimuria novae-zelandiae CBS 107.79]|uniref:Ribonuclease P protein subunit n=1 Tax=Bimuria novae-zelandiae CBS 107.79 TaxID=1447943 RepID=A0A6A5ULJ4_9PLEO|nr:RNase P/MRP, p29 subunit [Bimuria novae-zelandiae CBS 107.79]